MHASVFRESYCQERATLASDINVPVADFADQLYAQSTWRKNDLNSLFAALNIEVKSFPASTAVNAAPQLRFSSPIPDYQKSIITRACYLVFYAHWEGFIKECVSIYLRNLPSITYAENPHLALYCFARLTNGRKPVSGKKREKDPKEEYNKVFQNVQDTALFLGKNLSSISSITFLPEDIFFKEGNEDKTFSDICRELTDTQSNLSSALLRNLLFWCDLDSDLLDPESGTAIISGHDFGTIDFLVDERNEFAHGNIGADGDNLNRLEAQFDRFPEIFQLLVRILGSIPGILINKLDVLFNR